MKTDITLESICSYTNPDKLAELTHALQAKLNAVRDWIADAKRMASEGAGYAPRDVFRAKEKELRDLGALMNAVNERRGMLRRLAHAATLERAPAAAKPETPGLLDRAIELLFALYNDSVDESFVAMLHSEECVRNERCTCAKARDFDLLMHAGGWSARSTQQGPIGPGWFVAMLRDTRDTKKGPFTVAIQADTRDQAAERIYGLYEHSVFTGYGGESLADAVSRIPTWDAGLLAGMIKHPRTLGA